MNQEQFIQLYEAQWKQLELWLEFQDKKNKKQKGKKPEWYDSFDFPLAYRQICHHFALAKTRHYSQPLIDRLSHQVLRGHQQFYQPNNKLWHRAIHFAGSEFPNIIRQQWRLVLLSSLMFYLPFIGMLVAIQINPDLVYSVTSAGNVAEFEEMYDPKNRRLGTQRQADSDVMMFGFYIRNNTGIGFRTFAGGLLFGLGSCFFLIFNGLMIGTVAGHLTQVGFIETFWGFVAGHSAMELTAIVFSGAAGLKLAAALLRPGQKSRAKALRDNGKIGVSIMYGAAAMFLIAAFIEAFWSSQVWMPIAIKYMVGIILWVLVLVYFIFAGRNSGGSRT